MTVDTERADDLDHLLDLMTSGRRPLPLLRGVDRPAGPRPLARAQRVDPRAITPESRSSTPQQAVRPLEYQPGHLATVPAMIAGRGVLNHASIAAFNEVWFRAAPRRRIGEIVAIPRYFHPLDAIGAWNRLYGRHGLVQYQILVPFGAEEALRTVVTRLAESRHAQLPLRAQALRSGEPGAAELPGARLDADARHPGRRRRSRRAARRARRCRARRRRPALPGQGRASPRPTRSAAATRGSTSGKRSATASIRTAAGRATRAAACCLTDVVRGRVMDNALGEAQTIVLFGGTSEIGRAIVDAVGLAGDGDGGAGGAAARRRRHGAVAGAWRRASTSCAFDAADTADHAALVERLVAAHGDLDVVIVAFGQLGDAARLADDGEAAAALADVNYAGAVSVCTAVAEQFRRQGHGRLVVLSSVAGERVRKANYVYGASKAGLDGFAQGLGDSLAGSGASVLIVRPGFVRSKMTDGMQGATAADRPRSCRRSDRQGAARRSADRVGAGGAAPPDVRDASSARAAVAPHRPLTTGQTQATTGPVARSVGPCPGVGDCECQLAPTPTCRVTTAERGGGGSALAAASQLAGPPQTLRWRQ